MTTPANTPIVNIVGTCEEGRTIVVTTMGDVTVVDDGTQITAWRYAEGFTPSWTDTNQFTLTLCDSISGDPVTSYLLNDFRLTFTTLPPIEAT
jgi:hypothetical protein